MPAELSVRTYDGQLLQLLRVLPSGSIVPFVLVFVFYLNMVENAYGGRDPLGRNPESESPLRNPMCIAAYLCVLGGKSHMPPIAMSCYCSVVCVCRLSHSCTLDGTRCHLVVPSNTVLDRSPGPHGKGRFGGQNPQIAGMPSVANLFWPLLSFLAEYRFLKTQNIMS